MKLADPLESRSWSELNTIHPDLPETLQEYEVITINNLPSTKLLSEITLFEALSVSRAKKIVWDFKSKGIYAEINRYGERRCVYVNDDGVRCVEYCTAGYICDKHSEDTMASFPMIFKSPMLQDAFKHHMRSPEKHSLDQEIATLRTMLTVVMQKLDDGITMGEIAAVTALCDKIANVVDKSAKLNVITPEKLQVFMDAMIDVMAKFIPPEKLNEAADEIERVNPLKTHMMIPYEPTVEVKKADLGYQLEKASVQKRALLDVAQHLGLNPDGTSIEPE